MNITNFARKLAEKPVFKTRIKSDQVKLPEIAIGYFLAPFCAMFANAIFGAYLNRNYEDVLLQHIFCRILKIKDQSHAKAHVITRPCVRLFFCVSLHDYTLLRGDSCAAKKRK